MSEETSGKKPSKVKKTKRKQSPETIAKRLQTMKERREGRAPPDIVGAIGALRAAKRAILASVCDGRTKDFGDIELNVLIALKHLQGG